MAFMDVDPGADGHLLVIPKQHSRDLLCVSPEDLTATTLVAQRIAKAMYTELGAEGVNLLNCCGTAGWQTVFHFHLHVIPQYRDRSKDRMELPFEPGLPSDVDARTLRATPFHRSIDARLGPPKSIVFGRVRQRRSSSYAG